MLSNICNFFKKTIGKKIFALLLILSLLVELIKSCALVFPFLIEKFVNQIQNGEFSLFYPKVLLVSYLVIFCLQSIIVWFYGKLQVKSKVKLQLSIFDNLLNMNPSEIKSRGEGFYTSLMERFVDTILNILTPNSISVFFSIVQIFIILCILFYKNIIVGAVCIGLVVLYLLAFILNNKLFSSVLMEYLEKNSVSVAKIYDFIKGNKALISSEDYKKFAHERVSEILVKVQNIEFKLQYFFELIFSTLLNFIQPCVNVLIILLMGKNVVSGTTSFGSFILVITYYNMLQSRVDCFQKAADLIFQTKGALNNLSEFINEEKIISSKKIADGSDFFIRFNDVSLSLGKEVIFDHVNLTISKGNNYGLVGFSGTGKSYFINMIMGLSRGDTGSIEFLSNGQNCCDVLSMQKFSVLTQSTEIFNLSLEENIFLSKDYDKSEFDLLVNKFDLHKLKDRSLGSEGSSISGGEKQKVLLARFVHQIKDKDYYILDEPFTGMDVLTKKDMISKLCPYIKDKTGVCITHDQIVLDALCNKILIINKQHNIILSDESKNIEDILLKMQK